MILCRDTKFKRMPLIYLSFVLNFKQHEKSNNANFVYFVKPPLADSNGSNKTVREVRYTWTPWAWAWTHPLDWAWTPPQAWAWTPPGLGLDTPSGLALGWTPSAWA